MESTLLQEIRQRPQWVIHNGSKIPLKASDGTHASVTDPSHWTYYETAHAATVGKPGYGLGFVLTPNDPFTVIDLDATDDESIVANQKEIFNRFNTYSERSPSGKGCHIWCKGSIPSGKKKDKVEAYSDARYMTVTLEPINNVPVAECQPQLDELFAAMNKGAHTGSSAQFESQPEANTDAQVIELCKRASTAQQFNSLWAGDISQNNNDHSAADLALMNFIAFNTDSKEQCARIFQQSVLGQRQKGKRADYIRRTVDKAFDNKFASGVDPAFKSNFDSQFKTPVDEKPLNKWPSPLSKAAYHGLTGKFLDLVAPETEADPAALCAVFLTAIGNVIGDDLYRAVGGVKHHTNLFTTIVGKSAKARKGQATADAMQVIEPVDAIWFNTRIIAGLTSGEGVIDYVRDALGDDPGEFDKRLFAIEGEFAQVLAMTKRDGNNLSTVLRLAWDSTTLQTAARSNKNKCRHPHVSIVANITLDELLRLLSSTNVANGFANRFLWVLAERSKQLPFGGNLLDPIRFNALVKELQDVCAWVKDNGNRQILFDRDVEEWWKDAYEHLTNYEPHGAFGEVIARSETQVLRLAMLYAILDRSLYITKNHLLAAMEVWRYCEESARYIFGDATGDKTVDVIYKAVMDAPAIGLTKTEINKLFNNNQSKQELNRALTMLAKNHKIQMVEEPTLGGTIERWCRL